MLRATPCLLWILLLNPLPLAGQEPNPIEGRTAGNNNQVADLWSRRLEQHRVTLASSDSSRYQKFAAIHGLGNIAELSVIGTSENTKGCSLQQVAVYALLEQIDESKEIDESIRLSAADELYARRQSAAPIILDIPPTVAADGSWTFHIPLFGPCKSDGASAGPPVPEPAKPLEVQTFILNPFLQIRLFQTFRDYLAAKADPPAAHVTTTFDLLTGISDPQRKIYPKLMQKLALDSLGPSYLLKGNVDKAVRKTVYERLSGFIKGCGGVGQPNKIREQANDAMKLLEGQESVAVERKLLIDELLSIALEPLDPRIRKKALEELAKIAKATDKPEELNQLLPDDGRLGRIWDTQPSNRALDAAVISLMRELANRKAVLEEPAKINLVALIVQGHQINREEVQKGILQVENAFLSTTPPPAAGTPAAPVAGTPAATSASTPEAEPYFATESLARARATRVLATGVTTVTQRGAVDRFGFSRGARANYPPYGRRGTFDGISQIELEGVQFRASSRSGATDADGAFIPPSPGS